jgi:hypothetical protein
VICPPDSFFHFPDALDKLLAPEIVTRLPFFLQRARHHQLRRDAGVVHSRQPQRAITAHALVRVITSIIVCCSAWPMCSEPVTFGGGMTIVKTTGAPDRD